MSSVTQRPARYRLVLTGEEMKLRPKRANIAGLQLADVLAFGTMQALLVDKSVVHDAGNVLGVKIGMPR